MPELKNTFSWSFSSDQTFLECKRKRFLAKYASWGGWDSGASPQKQTAYRLNKINNIYSLQGHAAELGVMTILREKQQGHHVDIDEIYEEVLKPYLNSRWIESKEGKWQQNPKKYYCLREHYYEELTPEAFAKQAGKIKETITSCLRNFSGKIWDQIADVKPEDEIAIRSPEEGDAEFFMFNGVKVYAIPDYVFKRGNDFHIFDWKSGKQKPEHIKQLSLYGLWAVLNHGIKPEDIIVSVIYLATGDVKTVRLQEKDIDEMRSCIKDSVEGMAKYLIDGNIEKNKPLDEKQWERAQKAWLCKWCNFKELCDL